jgi:hypothetical protein
MVCTRWPGQIQALLKTFLRVLQIYPSGGRGRLLPVTRYIEHFVIKSNELTSVSVRDSLICSSIPILTHFNCISARIRLNLQCMVSCPYTVTVAT